MNKGRTALFLFGLLLSPLAAAEVYKWVDEKGKTHFGDKAPNKQAETLKLTPTKGVGKMDTPSSAQDFRQIQQNLVDSYDAERAQKKQDQNQQNQQDKAQQDKYKKTCAHTKAYLDIGGAVYKTGENGERVFLSEPEIAEYRAKKESFYNKNCR